MRSTRITLAGVLFMLLCSPAFGQSPPMLGAKVYRAVREPKQLVEFAKSLGLDTLFVGDELAASLPFREQCRAAGLKYFLIIRTFNDPEAAKADPTLVSIDREGRPARREADVMICPSRQDFRRAKLEEIRVGGRGPADGPGGFPRLLL
ncbi:MAG: hypothetical protein ABSA70_07825 [Terriglobia bacterium]